MNLFKRMARPFRHQRPALPVVDGPNYCPHCWARPGRVHELSCPEVTFDEFIAFIDRSARLHAERLPDGTVRYGYDPDDPKERR